jgi:SAM-dependent methyltransferase
MKKHTKLAADFYDEIIDLHHDEFNYKGIQYSEWLDLLASKLGKGASILDLGCGNGRALKYLVDKGFQGVGVDVSEKMIRLARKHVPKGKFLKKDFGELDFKEGSFDAVISFFALNHIPKDEFKKVIHSSKKILKKHGLLLLGMVKGEDEGFWKGFYGTKMELFGSGYKEKELIDILESTDFKILKIETRHFKGKHFEEDDIYILAILDK